MGQTTTAMSGNRYRCVVSNEAGSTTSDLGFLTVVERPQPPSYSYYTVTVTAGEHGSVFPSGSVRVREGADRTFSFTPDEGYRVADVLVDGVSVGAVGEYTFRDVRAAHTVAVSFEPDTVALYRLYNTNSGEHSYTASRTERLHLVGLGWRDEGIAFGAEGE